MNIERPAAHAAVISSHTIFTAPVVPSLYMASTLAGSAGISPTFVFTATGLKSTMSSVLHFLFQGR